MGRAIPLDQPLPERYVTTDNPQFPTNQAQPPQPPPQVGNQANGKPAASAEAISPPDPYVYMNETLRWARIAAIFGGGAIITLLLWKFIALTGHSIALLFVAIVIGEALAPVVNKLSNYMKRGVAIGLLFLVLIASLVGIGAAISPQITDQATSLVGSLPDTIDRVTAWFDDLPFVGNADIWAAVQSGIGNFTATLVSVPVALFSSVAQIFIVSFMSAYWLLSRRGVRQFLESLVPDYEKEGIRKLLMELSQTVGGYVRGTGMGALIIGVIVFIGLSIMGVNYPLIMAIFAAFGELIPILGPNLAAIPAVIVAFLESWQLAFGVIVFYVVLQQLESVLLVPALMNAQANIPPLIVIISVSFGGAIAGVLGAIIAIPAAGALRVIILRMIAPAIRRWSGAEAEPLPENP